ncbi:MAG: putative glycolipid-binding domain-containing protein [Thermoanaerobaculia bacterium]
MDSEPKLTTVLWRRLDVPGHECATLREGEASWLLRGTALFAHDGMPVRLDYLVICDRGWATRSARVDGFIGERHIGVKIAVRADGTWEMNGVRHPAVAGCIDLDLNFSPSTNLLPLRRLDLAIDQESAVRAAWLRFPEFTLEPLEQTYRRVAGNAYRYASSSGFTAEIEVNDAGLPIRYDDVWVSEAIVSGYRSAPHAT